MFNSIINSLPLEDQPFSLDNHGPVFILGCPRSGTTFLSNVFGSIEGFEEFIGILAPPRVMHLLDNMEKGEEKTLLMHSIRDIFWQSFWRRRASRLDKLRKVWQGSLPLRGLFEKGIPLKNTIFCYKEPFMCFAAVDFAEYFTNAKFVHIIRDGRDNADSLDRKYTDALSDRVLKSDELCLNKVSEIGIWHKINGINVPYWVPDIEKTDFTTMSKYERCVLMWREMVLKAKAIKEILPKERYYEVKYEDLVLNPIKESEGLARFLGKELSTKAKKKLAKAYSTSVGISKSRVNPEKIAKANYLAGNLLRELGYLVD